MEIDDLKIGEINRSKSEVLKVGGKGINVSLALSELGTKSTVSTLVAGAVGQYIISELDKIGIDTISVNIKGCSRINVKLACENETAINGSGGIADLKDVETLCSYIKGDNNYIVLSGSVCRGLNENTYAWIMENVNGRFVVDAEGELLINTLKYRPFIVKPNHIELGEIFGCSIDSFEKAVFYGRKLCEMGAENVIVSMGSMGSVFVNKKDKYIRQANTLVAKNTVGAGDTMVAGFLHSVVTGHNFKDSIDFASAFVENKIMI